MSLHAVQSEGSMAHDTLGTRTLSQETEDRSSRRWISKRIESLDPVRDYAEIVKLSTIFRMNPFMGEWAFAVTMPRFSTGPSAPAISRDGKGKLLLKHDRRVDDTVTHFLVWAEHGPESPQARRSVDLINLLHAKWYKEYPAEFEDPDLWMYVIAWEVCGTISLFTALGLPEPSEKEKIALNIFGQKLAELFVYIDGRPLPEIGPMPGSYDEWMAFLHKYEAQPWTYNASSEQCAITVLENFEKRFPRRLRSFGRALATSFWHKGMFDCNHVKPPSRVMRWAARTFMKTMLLAGGLMPDPKESYPERLRREAGEKGVPLNPVMRATQCPMGFGRGNTASTKIANH